MDKNYRITFSDGNKRIMGFHNENCMDEPMGLADILLFLLIEGKYSLDDIIKIEVISDELISKDLKSGKAVKVRLNY